MGEAASAAPCCRAPKELDLGTNSYSQVKRSDFKNEQSRLLQHSHCLQGSRESSASAAPSRVSDRNSPMHLLDAYYCLTRLSELHNCSVNKAEDRALDAAGIWGEEGAASSPEWKPTVFPVPAAVGVWCKDKNPLDGH